MSFHELTAPEIEIPAGTIFHRYQRTRACKDSVRINRLNLAPPAMPPDPGYGRFDTPGASTAYLADSPLTTLYKTRFRRNAKVRTLDELLKLSLVAFRTVEPLRVAAVCALAEAYPVLQSERYRETQQIAARWKKEGFDGVLYASAQHPGHLGLRLFEQGMSKVRRIKGEPLVERGSRCLHKLVVQPSICSVVPILTN